MSLFFAGHQSRLLHVFSRFLSDENSTEEIIVLGSIIEIFHMKINIFNELFTL